MIKIVKIFERPDLGSGVVLGVPRDKVNGPVGGIAEGFDWNNPIYVMEGTFLMKT